MTLLDISFASGEQSLSVRRIEVHEGVSTLYTATVWARSPHADIDLEPFVGQPSALTASGGSKPRVWSGIVAHMEQVRGQAGESGSQALSTYVVRIVPRLWLLTQRQNHRIFQHLSIPDITDKVLGEWGLSADWKIDRGAYPKLEFEVQYGESDFNVLSRLWEEAGIAFAIPDGNDGKTVTLGDKLQEWPMRGGDPIRFLDAPNQTERREFVTGVTLSHEVRPGARTHRDYDMRNPRFALFGSDEAASGGVESKLEQFHYEPHGFLVEGNKGGGTPNADDRGVARHDQSAGQDRAARHLAADRTGKVRVSFETNVVDLVPGSRFSMSYHPHAELDASTQLLVTDLSTHAGAEGEWSVTGEAVKSDVPFRPALTTPRPKIHSVQTATVVGPAGDEIHTDEFGRVRVQFPWDREGQNDAGSSCWIRVAQGWGGTGYGMIVLPRVGQEVLVSFLDGEPDAPIVVGRVFNATEAVPYKLPDHKTRSTWKSDSSPGHGGFNEIMMEDLAGMELVYVQAQKNLRKLVKNNETITVGNDRQKYVLRNETETTGQDRQEVTGRDRTEITDRNRTTSIGGDSGKLIQGNETEQTVQNLLQTVGGDHDVVTKKDKREKVEGNVHLGVGKDRSQLIEGKQSLTVGGDQQEVVSGNHALDAGGEIHWKAGGQIVIEAPDVTISGAGGFIRLDSSGVVIKGTMVLINSGGSAGSGAGSNPTSPDAAKEAVVPQPPRPVPDNVAITGLAQ
jgi:type VI secretion system secreted protein VgrG